MPLSRSRSCFRLGGLGHFDRHILGRLEHLVRGRRPAAAEEGLLLTMQGGALRNGLMLTIQGDVDLRAAPPGGGLFGGLGGGALRRALRLAFSLLSPLGGSLAGLFRHLGRGGAQHNENAHQQADGGQDGVHDLAYVRLAQLCQAAAQHAAAGKGLPLRPQGRQGRTHRGLCQQQMQQAAPQQGREQGTQYPPGSPLPAASRPTASSRSRTAPLGLCAEASGTRPPH